MADETIINDVASDTNDRKVEITGDEDLKPNDSEVQTLMQKITALEQEKRELVHENDVIKERIHILKDEIDASETDKAAMKSEIEKSVADKKALESIAARAAQLETEVSRLQHDLILSMTEGQEANGELMELKREIEELRKRELEKDSKLDVIEKERNLLLESVNKVKESKEVSENRIRELEKKIEGLEVSESDSKSHRVKIEEEMRGKVEEREDQIRNLNKLVEEFQLMITRNQIEIDRSNKEKEELVIVKNELEALLKKSERKNKEIEHKLSWKSEQAEKTISGLKEKAVEIVDGANGILDRDAVEDEVEGLMGLKVQWPLVAASAGVIAAVAIVYLRFKRQG